MSKVRKAVFYSSLSQYGLRSINLISIVVFSRLLTPEEIGIFAIASSLILFASELRLLGTGNYLIRETKLTDDKIKSATGLTTLISWPLGLIVFIGAPYLADFYNQTPLQTILKVLALSFFLAPFISVTSALLSKRMQFKEIFFAKFTAQCVGFFSTLTLILLGASYYSLALGAALNAIVEFLILYRLRPKNMPWKPSFKNLKEIAKFGSVMTLSNLMFRFGTIAPDLIIGKLGTPNQVAIFSRGLGFMDFLTNILTVGIKQVSLPYLSKVNQAQDDIGEAYIKATTLTGAVCWPVLAVAGIASFPIIRVFFGKQWDDSVPIASALAFWALLRSIHTFSSPLLVSAKKEHLMLIKEAILFVLTALGIYLAYPHGLITIAFTMVSISLADVLINSLALKLAINMSIVRFFYAMRSNILLTVICSGATFALDQLIPFQSSPPIISLLLISIVLPPIWIITLKLLKHDLYFEIQTIVSGILNKRFKK